MSCNCFKQVSQFSGIGTANLTSSNKWDKMNLMPKNYVLWLYYRNLVADNDHAHTSKKSMRAFTISVFIYSLHTWIKI